MITTKGKTDNEIYREIAEALISQGVRCTKPNDNPGYADLCAYGNELGHHCAVGFLLDPDNKDAMKFHGSVVELVENDPHLIPEDNREWISNKLDELVMIQDLHDDCSNRNLKPITNRIGNEVGEMFKPWVELMSEDDEK